MPFICIQTWFKSCPCLFFYCYDKHHHQKRFGENRVYFASSFCFLWFFYLWALGSHSITEGSQSKNPSQELGEKNWSRNHGGMPTYWIAQHSLLYNPWHLFRGLSTYIINQENIPQDWLTGQSYEGISDFRFPLSRWPILCQVNKIDN